MTTDSAPVPHARAGIFALLGVGVLFGISGPLAKVLGTWLNPYQVVILRLTVACAIAIAILILTRRRFAYERGNLPVLVGFALSFPISVVLFTLGVFGGKVSLAIFGLYIADLLTSFLLGGMIFRERLSPPRIAALALTLLAVGCFTLPQGDFALAGGFLFGIASGVVQAISSAFKKAVNPNLDRIWLVALQTAAGVLLAAIILWLFPGFAPQLPVAGWSVGLVFGAMFLVISYLSLFGFQKIDLNIGSILVSTELFFGPLFAFFLFQESLKDWEWVGAGLTIAAVALVNLPLKKRN